MYDHCVGGHDTLTGGAGATNSLYGDAYAMYDHSHGGNDTLLGGAGAGTHNNLFGDAQYMYDNSVGGNDTLTGGAGGTNNLFGDAQFMFSNSVGGNDRLISGTASTTCGAMPGFINGVEVSPTTPTGNVITGADIFVFAPNSNNDYIYDFRQSDGDKIDVSAYGFHR